MYYLSDVIDDLASLFNYICGMEKKYADYGLDIDTNILVLENGFKVEGGLKFSEIYIVEQVTI